MPRTGAREERAPIFETVSREVAVEKWAGWWTNFLRENYDGKVIAAAKDLFGIGESGNVKTASQAQKWQFTHTNSLPSLPKLEIILEKAGAQMEDVLNHNYPPKDPYLIKTRNRHTGPKKMARKSDAVFHIDNPEVPSPDMTFKSSDQFENYYEFELKAVLPMAGVLALMAMLDDATS